MREALTEFLQEVRVAGVAVSVAESIDAIRAAAAVLPDREILREALAAAVVKDETDRAVFDEVFDRFFSSGADRKSGRRRAFRAGESQGSGRSGAEGEGAGRPPREEDPEKPKPAGSERPQIPATADSKPRAGVSPGGREIRRRRRRRELMRRPFRGMDPLEAEELSDLAADLVRRFRGRLRRRLRRGPRGRLDFRRTFRRSVARGGVPVDLSFRRRRPGRPDLVALCDVSGSVRHASDFFAALLAPCEELFRRVRLFAFIDHPVEASVESGRLIPHEPIDFHAFSDFGRVLVDFVERPLPLGRNTVLLVLGDARNNRRPHRADLLAGLRTRVRAIWWLDPEPPGEWGRGDSVIDAYRPACDAVLACANGSELVRALAQVTRVR